MKRTLIVLCALLAFFSSCSDKQDFKRIEMSYVTPDNGIIPAEGGEIIIGVTSTHSFRLTSTSSDVSFLREGLVQINKEGVALVETKHSVNIQPNTTSREREIVIQATHLTDAEISGALLFKQLPVEENTADDTEQDPEENSGEEEEPNFI